MITDENSGGEPAETEIKTTGDVTIQGDAGDDTDGNGDSDDADGEGDGDEA